MNLEQLEYKLKEQILDLSKKKVDLTEITDGTNLVQDLGFDSIQIVQMIAELEDSFDILFEDDELDMSILADFINLKELMAKKVESSQAV